MPEQVSELTSDQSLSNRQFSVFNQELIDRYFNEEGKRSIYTYIATQVKLAREEGVQLAIGKLKGSGYYDEEDSIRELTKLLAALTKEGQK